MEQGSGRSSRSSERNKKIEPKSEANNFPNIPEEIIVEILSRLPHDSLCRLRCVSKHWSSLISDSNLITLSKRRKVFVMSKSYDHRSFSFHSIDQQCSVEKVQTPWEKNLHLYHDEVNIYGSCNGLFLLGLKVDLYLWNPLNGYFNKVLSYHRLMPPYESSTSGLCYDSSTNAYKAVMAFGKFVMVGYFRRKCWKEVHFPYNIGTIRSGPVVNGRLHWFACKTNSVSTRCILAFDPQVDEFKKVPLPKPPKDGGKNILLGLGVVDECLCMTRLHQGHQGNAEVWVMKEYGVKKSWNFMFTISSSTFRVYSELVPLCCTEGGKVLMREHFGYDSGHVNVYNSNGDLDGNVPSPCKYEYSIEAIEYVESSVKPTGYKLEKAGYKLEKEERRGIATYMEHFLSASPRKMIKGKGDSKWEYLDPEEAAKGTRKKRSLKRNRQ